jgi:hypothetical protein
MFLAALRRGYPVMVGIWRIIANVLLVPAFQLRHPVAVYIHMKPNDLAQGPGPLGFHWPHASILRAFLRSSSDFWEPRRVRQLLLHEVLHSVCYVNKEPN